MAEETENKTPKAIQDNDWLYNLLSPLVQYGCRCHYKSFVVRGKENLPADAPYIIAPCHQQALMEPLAVLCVAPKPPVFLARADLFKKPTLRKILTFLKIMPVYRIRDGKSQLGLNQEVFDLCRDVLLDGSPLCLMAEGRHNNRHHLLPFGKGMFRIAGEAQLALGDRQLYIVPVGIDFDEYERPYSNLVVNIGQPIAVQPFMDTYRTDEPVALNNMRSALTDALLPLMHDIRNEEHYDEIMTLCNVMNRPMRQKSHLSNNAWNRFLMRRQIAGRMEALRLSDSREFDRMTGAAKHIRQHLEKLGVDEKTAVGHWNLALTICSASLLAAAIVLVAALRPLRMLALFLLICYPWPFIPTHLAVRRKVADPQFRSSFNWGVRFFGSIVYALIIGIVMACTGGMWMRHMLDLGPWWGVVAVAIAVIGARLSAPVVSCIRSVAENLHYWTLRLSHKRDFREIDRLALTLTEP